MQNYAKTKRIPLNDATKEEIIAAIKRQFKFEPEKKIEETIYWVRIEKLLDERHRVNEQIQNITGNGDRSNMLKRLALHKKFDIIDKKLGDLQGTIDP